MENKDRMFTGDLYLPNDAAITEEQNACLELLYTFNQTRPSEQEKRNQLLKQMFAEIGENCYIEPPFHANFGGKHVHFGKNVYANFNLTRLAVQRGSSRQSLPSDSRNQRTRPCLLFQEPENRLGHPATRIKHKKTAYREPFPCMPSFFSCFNNICLQCNAVLFQQCPCGIHRIYTRCIFHRCKFLFPFYFIQQTIFLHVYHIQHQSFQLIAVRLFWLDCCCAVLCQASNLLECPMQR